jgi:hypothetical protein
LSGAPGWLLLAWALAGLLTITGALCCSELATMMPRAGGVYVWDPNRAEWCASLFSVAAAPCVVGPAPRSYSVAGQSVLPSENELFMYACKIKETTNGCRGCARGKTRKAFKIVAQRRFAKHAQINEQSGASQNGQDQAKETAEEEAALRSVGFQTSGTITCLAGLRRVTFLHDVEHLP